ncbi:MAG: hypothetical protein H7257_03220 [Taibaiella sp.]|nr:hypothetical protein [Taibaiella sp.]
MDNQQLAKQIELNSAEIESLGKNLGAVVLLLERISNAVDEGFRKVNDRLSVLEGREGMQRVNTQLGEIKNKLHKIQKSYPYDELYKNIKSISLGEA